MTMQVAPDLSRRNFGPAAGNFDALLVIEEADTVLEEPEQLVTRYYTIQLERRICNQKHPSSMRVKLL